MAGCKSAYIFAKICYWSYCYWTDKGGVGYCCVMSVQGNVC